MLTVTFGPFVTKRQLVVMGPVFDRPRFSEDLNGIQKIPAMLRIRR